MHFSHLALTDFRSYESVDVELEPGVNALVGPNGQGKTNLVEALGYVATLGSHRVTSDAALVRAGAPRAVVRARVIRGDRAQTIDLEITPGSANRARLNRSPVKPREVLGIARTVLFAPEDLALVKGDPEGRRRFLDDLAVLALPRVAAVLGDYDRVLRQRGALLKSAGAVLRAAGSRRGSPDPDRDATSPLATLDVWDERLVALGARIIVLRRRLTAALAPYVMEAYAQVSASSGAALIAYRSTVDEAGPAAGSAADDAPAAVDSAEEAVGAGLRRALAAVRTKEIERGVTLVGPHRDDLVLTLGDLPAKGYASHGESWSFALALRLAAYRLLSEGPPPGVQLPWVSDWGPGGEPVLVLDDVFAELDTGRRDRLADLVARAGQVVITAAVPQDVPERLSGALFEVGDGKVRRVR